MRQIELHKQIDKIIYQDPESLDPTEVLSLVTSNNDTYMYFYDQVDKRWLEWLWENEFLNKLQEKTEGPSRFSYRMPELQYLVRMADKKPQTVTDIMLGIPINSETFNPEVVSQFLRICAKLPGDQLAKMAPKIRDEQWVKLIEGFSGFGAEYKDILSTLKEAADYESIITLAEALLLVRPREEVKEMDEVLEDNPFYFDELSYTGIFRQLAEIGKEHALEAFKLVLDKLTEIVNLGDRDKKSVFDIVDRYHFFDVDFFSLDLEQEEHVSHRENSQQLAAAAKKLSDRTIGANCNNPDSAIQYYDRYIVKVLPDSQVTWRFKLYISSLCPNTFKEQVKTALFRLFENRDPIEIDFGAEYGKLLQNTFSIFNEQERREYIDRAIEYFTREADNKDLQKTLKIHGEELLSILQGYLTVQDKERLKQANIDLIPDYEPTPPVSPIEGGMVQPQAPEKLGDYSIEDISNKLKNEWAPRQLREMHKNDYFLRPTNAEGVGNQLRTDIAQRLPKYLEVSELFFDRENLSSHYTYSFLRGVESVVKNSETSMSEIDWSKLIQLFLNIKESSATTTFDDEKEVRQYDTWLAGWTTVHGVMAELLEELMKDRDDGAIIKFTEYRDQLFSLLDYLLKHTDPKPQDEDPETATSTISRAGSKEALVTSPYMQAINSVRGKAFEAFMMFVYQDGKKFGDDADIKLSQDAKGLYKTTLKRENTRALMCMFGRYIPSFYYRDREWIRGLLPKIFSKDPEQSRLYLAAWEGYLINNLFKDIFTDRKFQNLYKRGLEISDIKETTREYFRDPDEGIAAHLALAYVHYEKCTLSYPLLEKFWNTNNPKQHQSFVDFLGRKYMSSSNEETEQLIQDEPRVKRRLRDLWKKLLNEFNDPELFQEFEHWINLENGVFSPKELAQYVRRTLEKTGGVLEWHIGLQESIEPMSEAAPHDALEIIRLYLLEGGVRKDENQIFILDEEWYRALQVLYNNPKTKTDTYNLIDDLIHEGSSRFWELKEVVED